MYEKKLWKITYDCSLDLYFLLLCILHVTSGLVSLQVGYGSSRMDPAHFHGSLCGSVTAAGS